MKVRQLAVLIVAIVTAACTNSTGPGPNSALERGYFLTEYGSNAFVPPVISADGRSIFALGGDILLGKDGTATARMRYRLDSNTSPEKVKVFTGTWTKGSSIAVITLDGAAASETIVNGIYRATMTATWSDSGVTIGGVFRFSQALPE